MHRRRVILAAAAGFAIGVAFAAQPLRPRADSPRLEQRRPPWVPGADRLMSAHELGAGALAPPR